VDVFKQELEKKLPVPSYLCARIYPVLQHRSTLFDALLYSNEVNGLVCFHTTGPCKAKGCSILWEIYICILSREETQMQF